MFFRKIGTNREILSYHGRDFDVKYGHPTKYRSKPLPLRARVTPLTLDGQYVTKAMLGRNSKERLNKPARAKSKEHFRKEVFPIIAEEILKMLRAAGLIKVTDEQDDADDLCELLELVRDAIFLQHDRWADSTKTKYLSQYQYMVQKTKGIHASELTNERYAALQEEICYDASYTSRDSFWSPGEEPPASAKPRLQMLRMGIQYLQNMEDVQIPCDPKRYFSRKRRTDELMDLLDNARLFPPECLAELAMCLPKTFDLMPVLFAIHLDTGLRISELLGLVWADVRWLYYSQGRMYYLFISGQLSPNGKRTSITKTENAYRYVPLSGAIGTLLYDEYQRLKSTRKDFSHCMIINTAQDQEANATAQENRSKRREYMQYFNELLDQHKVFEKLRKTRGYIFDEEQQDKQLKQNLTPHSLRRNFCSMLYAGSGFNSLEIFHQMGHDASPILPRKGASLNGGETDKELYQLCLRHEMHSPYSHLEGLSYTLGDTSFPADIPSSHFVLTLSPGQHVQIDVRDTQAGNQMEIRTGEALCCRCIHSSSTASKSADLYPVQLPREEGQYIHPEDYLPKPV